MPDRYDLDAKTVEMLVCPLTKTRLSFNAERTELWCRAARLAFPIKAGVPLLTLGEARPLTDEEYASMRG